MRFAIAGCANWRYGGDMGHDSRTDLKHLAGLLAAAATLASCTENAVDIQYDTTDRGITMPRPKLAAREKCYGIALAQFNDCAAGPGADCAGTATKDRMPDRWKYVARGSCTSQGGSLNPGPADE